MLPFARADPHQNANGPRSRRTGTSAQRTEYGAGFPVSKKGSVRAPVPANRTQARAFPLRMGCAPDGYRDACRAVKRVVGRRYPPTMVACST